MFFIGMDVSVQRKKPEDGQGSEEILVAFFDIQSKISSFERKIER